LAELANNYFVHHNRINRRIRLSIEFDPFILYIILYLQYAISI